MNRDDLVKLVDSAVIIANENFKKSNLLQSMSDQAVKNIDKTKTLETAFKEAVLMSVDMASTISTFVLVETLTKLFDNGIIINAVDSD